MIYLNRKLNYWGEIMALNPILFSKDVFSAYTEFLINFINFQDPDLEKDLKELIKFDLIKGSRLIKGPYISLNKPYKIGKNLEELSKSYKIHSFLKNKINFNLYSHQEEAFKKITEENNVVISTGTGSGKTESFLFPILNKLLLNESKGLKVLIIYPMNALVNDQMIRIKKLFSGSGITFGKYTGETPQKNINIKRFERPTIIKGNDEEAIEKGEIIPFEEKDSREEIQNDPPNVLVTNYSQLEYLLLREDDLKIFKDMDLEYIILDEIHTYVGEQGSEVAALLRRIKALAKNPEKIKFIGTSATIASGNKEEKEKKIENFAKKLFGVDNISSIFEEYSDINTNDVLYEPSLVKNSLYILNDIIENELNSENYYYLTGKNNVIFKEDIINNAVFRWIIDFLKEPMSLEEVVNAFKKKFNRNNSDNEIAAEIYSYLLAGIEIKNDDDYPLIRPKMHFFVKGINNLRAYFKNGKRYVTLDEDKGYHLYSCRNCGQHYYKGFFEKEKLTIKGIISQRAISEITSNEYEEILFTDSNIFFSDESEKNYDLAYLCEKCGTIHYEPAGKCVNCESKNIIEIFILNENKRCLSCNSSLENNKQKNLVKSSSFEPVDLTILTENILSLADNPKIIIFTDNRQEASFLNGFMEVTSKRFIYRDRLYKFLKNHNIFYNLNELTEKFFYYLFENGDLEKINSKDVYTEKSKELDEYIYLEWFIYEEFCSQISQIKKNSLEKLGLLNIDYDLFNEENKWFLLEWSNKLNIDINSLKGIIYKILDYFRRRNTVDLPILEKVVGNQRNKYKTKLNLPEYINMSSISKNSDLNSLAFISRTNRTYPQVLLQKEIGSINDEFLEELFHFLKKNIFVKKEIGRQKYILLDPNKIIIELNKEKKYLECKTCGEKSLLNRKTKNNSCTNYRCKSSFKENEILYNYDVKRYLNESSRFELKPMEHTGQIKKSDREAAERKFKNGDINVIVATSTLELGIDIGDLDFVLMRNVPPSPANYDQRVGRAGRRLKIGVAITYCGYSNHDQRFFESPQEMIKGEIKEPIFSTKNEPLFIRHIHSFIFTSLFLNSTEKDFELLKKAIPNKISNYLFDELVPDYKRIEYISDDLGKYYRKLISEKKDILVNEIKRYFRFWSDTIEYFTKIYNISEDDLAKKYIEGSAKELEKILKYTKDLYLYWLKKRDEVHKNMAYYNPYNQIINDFIQGNDEYYTLNYLKNHGFLPGYNLVKPGVTIFHIPDVEFFRPYSIALREASPFSTVYVNGKQYKIKDYIIYSTKSKDFIKTFHIHDPNGSKDIFAMHITDVELEKGEKIRSSDTGRKVNSYVMATDFNKNSGHLGGKKYITSGGINIEFYKNATFYLINTGVKDRGNIEHFYVCPECGYTSNKNTEEKNKKNFLKHIKEKHNNKNSILREYTKNIEEGGISIYSKHKSDIILIGGFEKDSEAASVGEAIKLGASLITDISENDLSFDLEYKNGVYNAIIYEDIPGGSGYVEFIFEKIEDIIESSINYLKKCKCEKACYKCLLSYWNQHLHDKLDRNISIEKLEKMKIIKNIITIPPAVEVEEEDNDMEESLLEKEFYKYLKDNGFPLPEKQYEITSPVNTRIDFAYSDKKIAIYLDGKPYHNDPKKIRQDQIITLKLEGDGWKVLRISSDDWNDEDLKVLKINKLKRFLDER